MEEERKNGNVHLSDFEVGSTGTKGMALRASCCERISEEILLLVNLSALS